MESALGLFYWIKRGTRKAKPSKRSILEGKRTCYQGERMEESKRAKCVENVF